MHARYSAIPIFVSCERKASVGLDLTSGLHVMLSRFELNGTDMNDTAGRESDFSGDGIGPRAQPSS